jgi:hypothetical protein
MGVSILPLIRQFNPESVIRNHDRTGYFVDYFGPLLGRYYRCPFSLRFGRFS